VIIKTVSTIHAIIRNIVLFIIALILSLVVWLYGGISIDKLKLYNISVDGLYLKLDKKLILKAKQVVLQKTKQSPKIENIDQIFDRIKHGFTFFEFVQLEKVVFKNNHYAINYVNNLLHVVSDEYEGVVDIKRHHQELHADVSLLYIKQEDITLWGKVVYHLKSGTIEAKGGYRAYDIEGKFDFSKVKNLVALKVDANETGSIERIIHRFIKKPKINEWILKRALAKHYRVNRFEAKGEIIDGVFKLDNDSLYGEAYAQGLKVYFQKDLNESVIIPEVAIRYQKGNLYFFPRHATYKDKNITSAFVAIEDLDESVQHLKIDLNLTTQFNSTIQEILEAYKLKVPIVQKRGVTEALLRIGVNLKTHQATFEGDFNLTKGEVHIAKAPLPINGAKISYANKVVHIKEVYLETPLYKGKVTGEVKLAHKKADLDVDLERFSVTKGKKRIVYASNLKLPLSLEYHDGIRFTIPSLQTAIYTKQSGVVMEFEDINRIKPYLKVLPFDIDGGKLTLNTHDFHDFTLSGYAQWRECFLYSQKDLCHTRLPFEGSITKGDLKLKIFGNKINYSTYNNTVYVKDLHIDLHKLLQKQNTKSSDNGKTDASKIHNLTILGKNSIISYKNYRLKTSHYSIDIDGNRLLFQSNDGVANLYFKKVGDKIAIDALNVDDAMLHPLINFDALKGGRYTLHLAGDTPRQIEGKIVIEGGTLERFQGYNNVVAFLNAIPALVALSNPGFNDKGYEIKEGEIEYTIINQNLIKFKSIRIVGGSSTIVGAGEINLATHLVSIDLAIQTAREIGKVLGSIPIVGYILVGDGKSVATGVTVRGSLDNPEVQSHAIKDMVSLPLGMIERLLKSPARLIEGSKKANSKR